MSPHSAAPRRTPTSWVLLLCVLMSPAAAGAETSCVAVYDVSDLLGAPAAALDLAGEGTVDAPMLIEALRAQAGANAISLPDEVPGAILIVAEPAVHHRVAEVLGSLRVGLAKLEAFEIVVARYQPHFLAEVWKDLPEPVGFRNGPRTLFRIGEEHRQAMERGFQRLRTAEIVDSEVLTTRPGEEAALRRTIESRILADYDLRIFGPRQIAEPQVRTVRQGYEVTLRPQPGGTALAGRIRVGCMEALTEVRTPLGALQIPETSTVEVDPATDLPVGTTLLLAGILDPTPLRVPRGQRGARATNLLIWIRRLPPTPNAAQAATPAWIGSEVDRVRREVPTPQALESAATLTIHDVRDLLASTCDFPAPSISLEGSPHPETPQDGPGEEAAGPALAAWIRGNVVPAAWNGEDTSIRAQEGQLLVRQAPAMQTLLGTILEDLRRARSLLLSLEVRILTVGPRASLACEPAGCRIEEERYEWNRPVNAEAFLSRALRDPHVTLLAAPRLTTFSGQLAHVVVATQTAFIAGWEVETSATNGSSAWVCDPVIETATDGILIEVRGAPTADRRSIVLRLDTLLSTLLEPMRRMRAKAGDSENTIELPDVATAGVSRTLCVPDGGTVLLGAPSPPGSADAARHLLLVTARLVDLEEVLEREK